MKRLLASLLCIVLLMAPLLPAAQGAVAYYDLTETETLEDGSKLVTSIRMEEDPETGSVSLFALLRAFLQRLLRFFGKTDTVSRTKYLRYYDSKGVLLWTAYLNAAFTYNGKKATCTRADIAYEIHDNDWTFTEGSAEKTGGTAKATVTFRQHKLGVPLRTITRTLTLSCDRDGKIE